MSDENQLPSDSDSDDEDYVPEAADCASDKSEISEDDDATEANSGDSGEENRKNHSRSKVKKIAKNRKQTNKSAAKKRDINEINSVVEIEKSVEEKQEEEKKKADALWADFMKDTGTTKRTAPGPSSSASETSNSETGPPTKVRAVEKTKITEVYHFAGEEVKVEKEVPIETVKAVLTTSTNANEKLTNNKSADSSSNRPKRGGISSVLGMLGKKNKISTLEKSKLDWENFKKEEKLEEEIVSFNRGKNGYLERQDFLQRADLRQFEIEKQLRNSNRRSAR